MQRRDVRVNLWELVASVSRCCDLMSPVLAQHHQRVAGLALHVAAELGLPLEERAEIALAGALHDIGAFSLRERVDLLAFEDEHAGRHARAGYLLLRGFPPFARLARLVRHHHLPWAGGAGAAAGGEAVPVGSHVLHLADRAVVLLVDGQEVLHQVPAIRASIAARGGGLFAPEVVEAFGRAAERDGVWLELVGGGAAEELRRELGPRTVELDADGLLDFSRLLCQLVDFKSEFTAAHSSGVAAVSAALARSVGFSAGECRMFEVAAYLHDLGKLAVPSEILEKAARLTPEEWDVMRSHVYYTYQVLSPVEALGAIVSWSSQHQERLDGSGYPFRERAADLSLGSRIMAVADVFTGVTEDRPYRRGMARDEAGGVLQAMAGRGELDARLVALAEERYGELDAARAAAQAAALEAYGRFRAEVDA